MPPIPGTVDGQKVADKRTYIMPSVLIRYYQHNTGKWDDITDVRARTTDNTETITIRIGDIKHTWKFVKEQSHHTGNWKLIKQERV